MVAMHEESVARWAAASQESNPARKPSLAPRTSLPLALVDRSTLAFVETNDAAERLFDARSPLDAVVARDRTRLLLVLLTADTEPGWTGPFTLRDGTRVEMGVLATERDGRPSILLLGTRAV